MTWHHPQTREDWLALRRCGGSTVGQLLGVSPYGGPWGVLAERDGVQVEETEAMRLGRALEADLLSRVDGYPLDGEPLDVQPMGQRVWVGDGADDWVTATPDALARDGRMVVEAKTVQTFRGHTAIRPDGERVRIDLPPSDPDRVLGPGELPTHWLCQVAWYVEHLPDAEEGVMVVGSRRATSLDGLGEVRVYRLGNLSYLRAWLVAQARDRWHRWVLGDEEPPIDHTHACRDAQPRGDGARAATPDEVELMREHERLRDRAARLDRDLRRTQNHIRASMGDARKIRARGWSAAVDARGTLRIRGSMT